MDYTTIEKRLDSNRYSRLEDFASDVQLVYSNAMTYNQQGTKVHVLAKEGMELFDKEYENGVLLASSAKGSADTGDVCVLCFKSKRTYSPPVYICSGK